MSKQIIIDWQRDGLFVAMGSRRGSNVSIETLVTTAGEPGVTGSSTAISTQLVVLAKQLDLNKAEATVIAPREVLEFRTLSVPRGDADEIPDMVRFQAQRQMANIGDTWPLDYILLPDQPGQEDISSLAATISPAHMAEIEATCSDLGIQLMRVVPRPVEIARWGVTAGGLASMDVALIIALSHKNADILIASRGNLVQLRGTRLPEAPAAMGQALVAEIRRSLMAAAGFLNNQPLSKVLLIAAPEMAERVEAVIADATKVSVAVLDPAAMLPASLPERHELAQRAASRLAAIAGVLINPSPDKRDVIDLKNPKRREPKKVRVREYSIAAAAAGVLLLLGIGWWWWANRSLDAEIGTAQNLEKDEKKKTEASNKFIKQQQDVDKFLAGSINLLDEFAYLAAKIPPAEELRLANPTFDLQKDNSGVLSLVVEAKSSQAISQMELALADATHAVSPSGSKEQDAKNSDYEWFAKETIRVTGKGWDPLAAPSKSAAASESAVAAPTATAAAPNAERTTPSSPTTEPESAPAQSSATPATPADSPAPQTPAPQTPAS